MQILSKTDTSEALLEQGLEVWTTTPDAFGAYIKSKYAQWGRVIRDPRITQN